MSYHNPTSPLPCRHHMKTRSSRNFYGSNETSFNSTATPSNQDEKINIITPPNTIHTLEDAEVSNTNSTKKRIITSSYFDKSKSKSKQNNMIFKKRKYSTSNPESNWNELSTSSKLSSSKSLQMHIPNQVRNILCSHLDIEMNSQNTHLEQMFITKGNWCLYKGLIHIIEKESRFLPLLQKHGPPPFYITNTYTPKTSSMNSNCIMMPQPTITNDMKHEKEIPNSSQKDTQTSFQPLCRIIVGQQLGGAAASKIWSRFLLTIQDHGKKTTSESSNKINGDANTQNISKLKPSTVLGMTGNGDDLDLIELNLRKPAGLSKAKVRSIIDLAKFYHRGELSDKLLYYNQYTSSTKLLISRPDIEQIKSRLQQVKGIGPWTCDMFLMFHSHCSDILPTGDYGVRKGTTMFFGVKGKGKNGVLCEKKDADTIKRLHEPFLPYRALSTFYMWKCADTVDFSHDDTY